LPRKRVGKSANSPENEKATNAVAFVLAVFPAISSLAN
jgi:hypothetical protein